MLLPVLPGEVLDGKFAVEDVIGEGGMGFVLAARHVELDTPVAIKVLRPNATPESRQRFLREARAASQIENEHVARVFDVSRLDDGTPYMVMELLDGRDLDEVVWEDGPLGTEVAVDYALQACEALAAAHRRGVVHRDVKPANLFLTYREDGSPCIKLLDFGISKVPPRLGERPGTLTMTGSFVGSPQFMSPEQMASCRRVDSRSDLWSLGVCLFELLTGEMAFEGQTVAELYSAILRDEPRRIRDYRPDVPAALEWVVQCCLEKDAGRRVQTAEELADMLRPFSSQGDATESTSARPSEDPVVEAWPCELSDPGFADVSEDEVAASARPSERPPSWAHTEVMDRVPSVAPTEEEDRFSSLPHGASSAPGERDDTHDEALAPADDADQTPAGTVRPVSLESQPGATPTGWSRGRWLAAAGLVAGGLVAGGLLGTALAGGAPWAPQQPPQLGPAPQINAAPVLVVTSPPPPPASQVDPPPFVYSTQLSEEQRTHLLQELEVAAGELDRGQYESVLDRVASVTKELAKLGVEPHKANSSIGAKAQLLAARVKVAEVRALLQSPPQSFRKARVWSKRLDVRLAHARVAYDRVKAWGVRSFFRCGLVEMAGLDREAAAVFAMAAASGSDSGTDWYVAHARRHFKRARVGLLHALQVQSETMLCVDDAQQALDEVRQELAALPE